MVSSKIISAIFNDYVFFAFLILFVIAGLVLMMTFKTLSKHKKRLLIVLFSISILVLSRFLYLSHQFGNNEPAYIKRGLSWLSSNDVQIEKIEMSECFLTVEGRIPHKLEFICNAVFRLYLTCYNRNVKITQENVFLFSLCGQNGQNG